MFHVKSLVSSDNGSKIASLPQNRAKPRTPSSKISQILTPNFRVVIIYHFVSLAIETNLIKVNQTRSSYNFCQGQNTSTMYMENRVSQIKVKKLDLRSSLNFTPINLLCCQQSIVSKRAESGITAKREWLWPRIKCL